MSNDDPSIQAKVKAILVRKGVELTEVGFGVTNGVVSMTGVLRSSHFASGGGALDHVVQEAALAKWLERQIKRISGVRDVVFNLDHVKKDGARFRRR